MHATTDSTTGVYQIVDKESIICGLLPDCRSLLSVIKYDMPGRFSAIAIFHLHFVPTNCIWRIPAESKCGCRCNAASFQEVREVIDFRFSGQHVQGMGFYSFEYKHLLDPLRLVNPTMCNCNERSVQTSCSLCEIGVYRTDAHPR